VQDALKKLRGFKMEDYLYERLLIEVYEASNFLYNETELERVVSNMLI
jgi:hypothetical protein